MTPENYHLAWIYYLLSVVGIMLVWFRMTRGIKLQPVRGGLRVLAAALLLFPFSVGEGYFQLAPGILMVILETAFEGTEAFNRVGDSMTQVVSAALIASLLYSLWVIHKAKTANTAETETETETETKSDLRGATANVKDNSTTSKG